MSCLTRYIRVTNSMIYNLHESTYLWSAVSQFLTIDSLHLKIVLQTLDSARDSIDIFVVVTVLMSFKQMTILGHSASHRLYFPRYPGFFGSGRMAWIRSVRLMGLKGLEVRKRTKLMNLAENSDLYSRK